MPRKRKANNEIDALYLEVEFRSPNSDSLCYVCDLLVDCGATKSLMDYKTLTQLPFDVRPEIKRGNNKLKFADGSTQNSMGIVTLNLQIGDERRKVDFILGEFTDPILLGMANLQNLGLNIDFSTMNICMGDWWIPVKGRLQKPATRQVIIRKSIVIPPYSNELLEGSVLGRDEMNHKNDIAVFDCSKRLQTNKNVTFEPTMHYADSDTIPLIIYNPTGSLVYLEEDTTVGLLTGISRVISDYENIQAQMNANIVKVSSATVKETNEIELDIKPELLSDPSSNGLPEHLVDMFDRSVERLITEERIQFKKLLFKYALVFSKGDHDLGLCNTVECVIETGDAIPIKQSPRRMCPDQRRAAEEIIEDMLERKMNQEFKE